MRLKDRRAAAIDSQRDTLRPARRRSALGAARAWGVGGGASRLRTAPSRKGMASRGRWLGLIDVMESGEWGVKSKSGRAPARAGSGGGGGTQGPAGRAAHAAA